MTKPFAQIADIWSIFDTGLEYSSLVPDRPYVRNRLGKGCRPARFA